ncbi:TRAP dicarboxylate transporter, DctQ subunit, unknown substrate 6 [Rhodovulum sp. P5]|uniref:TRAP transporter small permease subunit n=1 Tax=Rhodovulum sp. P5 TaxID=1564506 RepID=UPI0009C321CF|nr:TRAP transporter small permease subunit [Rhodovulum sp. P5]ARE41801.1 TRAP dicarboxylate transporter, DctQ subunit, unknown substrate 6 [Rhodovulum sp. P5]
MTRPSAIAAYLAFCRWLDRITLAISIGAGLFLTGAGLAIVVMRYGFGVGRVELQDAAAYAFAVLLAFSLPVTLARDGHVRVEVISERLPALYLRVADILAFALFLIPVFALILWAGWADLSYAWAIREGAIETGGLGGLYLVKTALPVAAVLMILQGLARLLAPRTDRAGDA